MAVDKNYKIIPVTILLYLGQWPPENMSNFFKTLYTTYNVIAAIYISVIFATSEWLDLIHLMLIRGDVNKITNNLTHAVSHALGVIKHVNYLTKRERIRKVIREIRNYDIGKYGKSENFHPDVIIEQGYKKITKSTFILGGFATTFIIVGALAPAFTQLSNYEYYSNNTIDIKRPLPMSSWFPFNTNTLPNYYFAFAYQVFGLLGISWMIVALDNLFVGVVVELTAQTKILNQALITIKERSILIVKENIGRFSKMNYQANLMNSQEMTFNSLISLAVKQQLETCVLHHQKILDLSKEVESIFNINVIGQFTTGSIIICVSLFQCATRPISLDFAYMLAYLITISCQLFLYCWFGNELIVESNLLYVAIYKSDWISENESYKRSMSIIMARGKKPIVLKAAGFVPISTQAYASVMNASYSYFAILKQMYDK